MSRRGHAKEVYEDDFYYENVDRRRSRDSGSADAELESRRRRAARSPPLPIREIDERWRRREHARDHSAPDFRLERFLPPRYEDDDAPAPHIRRRHKAPRDDLRSQRGVEEEEIYLRRESSPPHHRPRRVSKEEVVFDETDDRRRRPREKEQVIFEEERRTSSPRRRPLAEEEDDERDDFVYLRREQSLPPHRSRRAKDEERIFIEDDRKRYEYSDNEGDDNEAVVRHRHRQRWHPSQQEDDVERERIELRRRSLPDFNDSLGRNNEEGEEQEEDKIVIRHKSRSDSRPHRERPLPRDAEVVEREREEEIIIEDRDQLPYGRSKQEEFVERHGDRPRRRRRDDEFDDVMRRRRNHSRSEREEDRDEVIIKHRHRSSPRGEDDREEIIIRQRDESLSALEDHREEPKIRRRHRHSRKRDEGEDEILLRRRSVHLTGDDREEISAQKDKHGRRLSLGNEIENDEMIIRHDSTEMDDTIEFRHGRGSHHSLPRSHSRRPVDESEEIVIREKDRDGPPGRSDTSREILIRKDKGREPSPEESPEPPIIRKPPIVQELITHHRHIDSYETIPPPPRDLDECSLTNESGDIEIKHREMKQDGRFHAEEFVIDHSHKDRSISPPRRPHSQPEAVEDEVVIKHSKSGDHGREKETLIIEREPRKERERAVMMKEEPPSGRRHAGIKDKRDRLWTELAKDLVVREAVERAGYEFEESDNYFYIFEYLRYDDVERLVNLSDDIRRYRRERIHGIRREREALPRLPVIPGPPPSAPRTLPARPPRFVDRPPAGEPYPWEGRERVRERDLIVEDRRSRPRLYREI